MGGSPAGAAWSRRRATRRGASACARRCRWRAPSACARTCHRPARLPEVPERVAGGVRDLPLGDAAGRAALARRGVSRRDGERLGATLGREVAVRIKAAIQERTGLTASAGVAPNKFLAKIASGWKKPDGLTVIAPERVEQFLQALPVDALWGVGPVTAQRLRERGIERLIDVRAADARSCAKRSAATSSWLRQTRRRHRRSARSSPNAPRNRRGSENTFATDLTGLDEIRREVDRDGARRRRLAARKGLLCRTVTIKVRYDDFTTITRSHSAVPGTRDADRSGQPRRRAARQDRGRRAAGPPARRQRPQPHGPGRKRPRAGSCRSLMRLEVPGGAQSSSVLRVLVHRFYGVLSARPHRCGARGRNLCNRRLVDAGLQNARLETLWHPWHRQIPATVTLARSAAPRYECSGAGTGWPVRARPIPDRQPGDSMRRDPPFPCPATITCCAGWRR